MTKEEVVRATQLWENGDITREQLEYIFPELKEESEDEKIKRILHSISSKMSFHLTDIFTEEEFQCFDTWSNAWLEKQGERVAKKESKCDADKKELKKIENKPLVIDEGKAEMDYCFTKMMNGEQINPAWSEEDGIKLGTLSAIIFDYAFHKDALNENNDLTGEYAELYNWLQSIPERFNLQSKQDWSEEDEEMHIDAIKYLELFDAQGIHGDVVIPCIEWLKSFRPRNDWKPSKEQIKALAEALSLAKNCGEESAFDLRTLYEQLKKLKGE